MATITTTQSAPTTAAEYEAAFERLMVEAEGIHERMRQDRTEIEQLELETKAIRSETRALLSAIGVKI